MLTVRDVSPKLIAPDGPALWGLPKTPAAELLVLVLAAMTGAAGVAVAGGSTGFPNTGALEKLNPEDLASWVLARLVDKVLLTGFVESSAWPTRSPEKLPSVSPAREPGNRSSPNLDDEASNLLEAVDRAIPEGAADRLLERAESPGEAIVVPELPDIEVAPAGGEFPGTVSQKGLPPPPNEDASSWLDSFVGGVGPGAEVKSQDGVGVIVPKLKPVPDGANENNLLCWLTADGVEVTAASVLAVPVLSPDGN